MKFEIQFPGFSGHRKLFDAPIIDPQAYPGSVGRGLTWKHPELFGPPERTIVWSGTFRAGIQDQEISSCEPSTLVLENRGWCTALGRLTLVEFTFAVEWVLGLKDLNKAGWGGGPAREIGFPITILDSREGGETGVIVTLQDLCREGGHYLPWQMENPMDCQWVVYRKK
jgi:hypothetical protein